MIDPPPLPNEPVPQNIPKRNQNHPKRKEKKEPPTKKIPKETKQSEESEDDGWEHYFDENTQKFFFYNNITKVKQWLNPRVPKNDESNQNLPTLEPPKLPFEEETLYERKLKELKQDPEFHKLSLFAKYKHVEALKKKIEEEGTVEETPIPTSADLQRDLKDIKPFSENTNFSEYESKSIYSQELNNSIRSINNNQKSHTPNKITKKQIKQFNDRKKQQRDTKLKKWLTED